MKMIYLDNSATTPVDKGVLKAMAPYFSEKFGNASSQHTLGLEAKRALEQSRDIIARSINSRSDEIIFTSGGTESNNFALKGIIESMIKKGKNHLITSQIEHDSVLNVCKCLEKKGCRVSYLGVDSEGFIDIEELKKSITPKTALVSIIHANNEIGTIQDIEDIGRICREKNIIFHSDACQSFTKTNLDVQKQKIDLLSLNAHKIHGPKGIGALYIRKEIQESIEPLFHGGGHENKLRSGTENIPGVVGFAKAVQISRMRDVKKMEKLRNMLIESILKIPNTRLNGAKPNSRKRLCNNVNISFGDIEGEAIGGYLDAYGICSSTGSACSSHTLEQSHVLRAIGLTPLETNSSLRLSLNRDNTKEEMERVFKVLLIAVKRLRRISPFPL